MSVDVEELYRRFGPMVLRRCRRLLRDEERAVDAMHDTFVKVLRQGSVDHVGSSWLYTVATNTCLNQIRTQRRRPEDGDALLDRIAVAPDERWQLRLVVDRIFEREQPSTRTMAVMHLVDGMTLQETADAVGLSVSGVRKRLRTLKAHVAELEGVQ